MKNRYQIIEIYNGLFDSKSIIATTDTLFNAVRIIEHLKVAEEENPCYSFDFQKIDNKVNDLDWMPGTNFDDSGKKIACKNYKDYLKKNFQKPLDKML